MRACPIAPAPEESPGHARKCTRDQEYAISDSHQRIRLRELLFHSFRGNDNSLSGHHRFEFFPR